VIKDHRLLSSKVLFYNGQWDFIVAAPTTEAMIPTIHWDKIHNWRTVKKQIWKVQSNDTNVAGYVKQFDNLTQIIVRDGTFVIVASNRM
jgi:hypothetical protein